eukprot:1947091-Lingulodinium_polyedra.AAC.1
MFGAREWFRASQESRARSIYLSTHDCDGSDAPIEDLSVDVNPFVAAAPRSCAGVAAAASFLPASTIQG